MPSVLQVVYNGLAFGSIVLLGAVGLSLLYGIADLPNFAHGELMALGAYFTFALNTQVGLPLVVAALISIGAMAVFGAVVDRGIFNYHRNSSRLSLLMLTVGIAFITRSVIRIIWGNEIQSYNLPITRGTQLLAGEITVVGFDIGYGLRITGTSVVMILLGLLVAGAIHLFLTRTKMGIAIRATAANRSLARVTGINSDRVATTTWVLSGALGALGGMLLAASSGIIYPRMGFDILLLLFAAVILGGIGSPYGAMAGAYLISFAREATVLIPGVSTGYRLAVAFLIMIAVLLIKPQGLAGGRWS